MTKEWYEDQKARMPEDEFAREIEINYALSASGIVFTEFKERNILRKKFTPNAGKYSIGFLDYGNTCACVFSQKNDFGGIVFFKEIVLIEASNPTHKLARLAKEYSKENKLHMKWHDDPAGTSDNFNNKDETSWKICSKNGIHPTHAVQGTDNKRKRNRVELTKFLLAQYDPDGNPLVMVHESMEYTIEAFQSGYRYYQDKNTKVINFDLIDEEHPHEDVMDCVCGTLAEEMGVGSDNKILPQAKKHHNRYTGY